MKLSELVDRFVAETDPATLAQRVGEFLLALGLCPNCGRPHDGLYVSETHVMHCGCYYEAQPGEVIFSAVNEVT